jgi:hypothetical protein
MPKLIFPFPYTVTTEAGGTGRIAVHNLLGRIAEDIPEIDPEMAPVVITLKTKARLWEDSRLKTFSVAIDYRQLGDVLLKPVPSADMRGPEGHESRVIIENAQQRLSDWAQKVTTPSIPSRRSARAWVFHPDGGANSKTLQDEDKFHKKNVISSDRESKIKSFAGMIGNYAFIDGQMYMPTRGPGFIVRQNQRSLTEKEKQKNERHRYIAEVDISVHPEIGWIGADLDKPMFFGYAAKDEAEKAAAELAANIVKRHSRSREWRNLYAVNLEPVRTGDIKIVRDIIRGDDRKEKLTTAVRQTLHSMRSYLGEYSPVAARKYAQLRTAFRGISSPETLAVLSEDLLKAVSDDKTVRLATVYADLAQAAASFTGTALRPENGGPR